MAPEIPVGRDDHQRRAADGGALLLGQQKQALARRTVGESSRPDRIAEESAAGPRRHSCFHELAATSTGDGSDVVDGGDGHDAMAFNGSAVAEQFHLSADGSHTRFTRDVGAITMDLNAIEEVDVASVGGNDTLTVDDLTGTYVKTINNDFAATLGGTTPGAGTAETIVNGTNRGDTIIATGLCRGAAPRLLAHDPAQPAVVANGDRPRAWHRSDSQFRQAGRFAAVVKRGNVMRRRCELVGVMNSKGPLTPAARTRVEVRLGEARARCLAQTPRSINARATCCRPR